MRKELYESPRMDCYRVVAEGFLCASLGDDPKDSEGGVLIDNQDPGVAIGGGTQEDGWDNKWGNEWDN